MPNSTSTYSSPNDLLSKLLTFVTANGWTQDTYTTDGGAGSYKACIHNGSMYVNMRTLNAEIGTTIFGDGQYYNSTYTQYGMAIYAGTANGASSSPWYNGAGAPIGNGRSNNQGVIFRQPTSGGGTYWFFMDSGNNNFLAVVMHTPGVYCSFGWGTSINKAGSWTGGMYFHATFTGYSANIQGASATYGQSTSQKCPMIYYQDQVFNDSQGFIRADIDTFTSKWLGIGPSVNALYGYTGRIAEVGVWGYSYGNANYPRRDTIQDRSYNAFNGAPILIPIEFYSTRDSGAYFMLGTLPNIWRCKAVGNGWNPGDEFSLGSDTYKLFPDFAVKKVA